MQALDVQSSSATPSVSGPGDYVQHSLCSDHPLQIMKPVRHRLWDDPPVKGETWAVQASILLPFLAMVEEDIPDICDSVPIFDDAIQLLRRYREFPSRPCIIAGRAAGQDASRKSEKRRPAGSHDRSRGYKVWPCATFQGELYQNLSRILQHFVVGIYTREIPHRDFRHIHAFPEWPTERDTAAYVLAIPIICSLADDSNKDRSLESSSDSELPVLKKHRTLDNRFSDQDLEELALHHLIARRDWAQHSQEYRWTAMLEIWEICFFVKNGKGAWAAKKVERHVVDARKHRKDPVKEFKAAREALKHELDLFLKKCGRRGKTAQDRVKRVFNATTREPSIAKPGRELEEGEIGYEFPSRRPTRRLQTAVTVPVHTH
ncbi:unnamed protein product [Peniophora sp. CBMAI 1063]|nr:unnamed protein product [Peniophora sp. CBMAI 1063]